MRQPETDIGTKKGARNRHRLYAMLLPFPIIIAACAERPDSDGRVDRTKIVSRKTTRFAVTIRRPSGPPRTATGKQDIHGNNITVACSTCHTTRPPNHKNRVAADLNEFHRGMKIAHGSVSCLSCHNPNDYDSLKLADGTRVEFSNVMKLCAQCHGPQMKDYEHGAHGGMSGYWDLSRGPRVKNNCIDCHNAHAPRFPKMQPKFKPRDRFLEKSEIEH